MECIGRMTKADRDFITGKITFTIETSEDVQIGIEDLLKAEKVDIKATRHRERRSLDSNAYAWVLMQKIAEATHSDKWEVYLEMLKRYSRSFTHIVVKPQAVDAMKAMYRASIDLGEIKVNGQIGHQLQVYFGSSTFDTKEMSVFLDGIISECKELGIETMSPEEIERIKRQWGV